MDISGEPSEFLYAILAGSSLYMTILTLLGHRLVRHWWEAACGHLALATNFTLLVLMTTGRISMIQWRWVLRSTLAVYGVTLLISIGRYWYSAWKHRGAR